MVHVHVLVSHLAVIDNDRVPKVSTVFQMIRKDLPGIAATSFGLLTLCYRLPLAQSTTGGHLTIITSRFRPEDNRFLHLCTC